MAMLHTKKFYFETLLTIAAEHPEIFKAEDEWTAFAEHEIEILGKGKEKKVAAQTEDNNKFLDALLALDGKATAIDIIKSYPDFAETSTQKLAAIAARLVKEGSVEKGKNEKGITEYTLVVNSAG